VSSVIAGAFSGAALVLCFPRSELDLLAWIALVPVLFHVTRVQPRRAMLAGAVMGLVFHLGNLYWVSQVMVQYGGGISRPTSVAILLALVAYLSLYAAAFGGLAAGASARGGAAALFVAPFLWVGLEFFRQYPFGGFPWCLLGYSQVSAPAVAQVASLVGVYGLSFLIVLVNALIAYWFCRPGRKQAVAAAIPVVTVVSAAVLFGRFELEISVPSPSYPVAAVQGNVLQEHKWDPGWAASIFARHLELSTQAAEGGARLIVWPESSTPFYFDGSPVASERMRQFVRDNDVFLLFGSDDYEISPESAEDYRAFNGVKLLAPDGQIPLRYHKMYLVPFGEFVPLRSLLGFARPLVQSVGDFSPGEDVLVAPVDGGTVGAFVCYEAIYSGLARRFVEQGASLLVNVTNDAWFGRSAAPYQHLSMARLRAIETRRYLVRAANTGISALVDPYGRILESGELFVPEVVAGRVGFRHDKTFYVRYGHLLPGSMAVVTLVFAVALVALHLRDKRRLD
jgi:apolipoprotein N-acyltransferase